MDRKTFIEKYYPIVKRLARGTGIFPETVLSQMILESSKDGKPLESLLTVKANNAFGVKATKNWKGRVYNIKTAEYTPGGEKYYENDDFRAYPSITDSIKDYLNIISKYYPEAVKAKNSRDQIEAIAKKYATAPTYAQLLNKLVAEIKPIIDKIKPGLGVFGGVVVFSALTWGIVRLIKS